MIKKKEKNSIDAKLKTNNDVLKQVKKVLLNIKNISCKLIAKINLSNLKLGKCNIKLAKEGKNTILFVIILALLSFVLLGCGVITTLCLCLLVLTLYFFRDPDRILSEKKNVIVSPCDGKILTIETANLPSELGGQDTNEYTKISVLLKLTNVHIQRIPVDCKVKQIEYIKGAFVNATFDKSNKDNERNIVLFERDNKDCICIVQIAGFVARRIVCNLEKDEFCKVGEKYGMIKFGSRIEIYLPKSYKIDVLAGQTLIGGETIIAEFN